MRFFTYTDRFDRKVSESKNKPDEIFTNDGESIGITYEYRTKKGIKELCPCGKVDRQEYIESFAGDCNIVNKIQKFLAGDLNIINPYDGMYGDFTNMPKTYAEMYERIQVCKNVFDSMSTEIKEKFDNSVEKFWSEFGSDKFNEIFSSNKIESEKTEPIVESEVKE